MPPFIVSTGMPCNALTVFATAVSTYAVLPLFYSRFQEYSKLHTQQPCEYYSSPHSAIVIRYSFRATPAGSEMDTGTKLRFQGYGYTVHAVGIDGDDADDATV